MTMKHHTTALAPAGAFSYSARKASKPYKQRFPHPSELRFFCVRAPSFVSHGYRILPICYGREGEEYNTRKGNNSGRLFAVFERPDRPSRATFKSNKQVKS